SRLLSTGASTKLRIHWAESFILSYLLLLVRKGRSHVFQQSFLDCSHLLVCLACLIEAESAVRAASNLLCIVIILPIIFPETHRTDLISGPAVECFVPATGTPKCFIGLPW